MYQVEIIRRRWVTDPIFEDRETVPVSLARNEIMDLLDVIENLQIKVAELTKGDRENVEAIG